MQALGLPFFACDEEFSVRRPKAGFPRGSIAAGNKDAVVGRPA
jgi:hypothetical protein